jgi:putative transposase
VSSFDIHEPIHLQDGISYHFIEQRSGIIRLRSDADGSHRDLHIAEIAQQIVGLPIELSASPRAIERLPHKDQKRVMTIAQHINEVATGKHPDFDEPRPQYDPALHSQNARRDAKLKELLQLGIPMSTATFGRKLAAFRAEGSAGLIDHRLLRKAGPLAEIQGPVLEALQIVIADQKNRSTGTKSRLIKETKDLLEEKFPLGGYKMPADSSMYRYIKHLTVDQHTTGSAKTRRSAANRPNLTFTTKTATLPGGEVQVDTTTLDMLIRTPSGDTVRPLVTVMFDKATRLVIAHTIRLAGTKGVDHAALLLQALTPPQNRPDKTEFRAAVQRANPHAKLLPPEQRRQLEARRPFVFPRKILMDNGRDYVGNTFIAALEKFGIDVAYSPPHTPTTKSNVERNFGSINTLFAQYQPGYTGGSPENRGYKVEDENHYDVFALYEVLDDWILNVWNRRPHGGLRDRLHPTRKLSPNEAYDAASEITATFKLPLTKKDYIDLLPSHWRAIKATGVQIQTRQYDSVELHPLRNKKSVHASQKHNWEVKVDPYNVNVAWVGGEDGAWIECQIRTWDHDSFPHVEDSAVFRPRERDRALVANVNSASSGTAGHLPTSHNQTPMAQIEATQDEEIIGESADLFTDEMDYE